MGRIQVIGRAWRGRCVFCHDDLAGEEVERCPGCHATWHEDCREEAKRCSTHGCDGPAPQHQTRPGRRRSRARRETVDTPFERRGPTRRADAMSALARSAFWHTVTLLVCGAYLSWPLLAWSHFAKVASLKQEDSPGIALFILGLVALAGVWFALSWLVRLPGVFLEVRHLLDSTDPTLMRLTVHKRVTTDSEGDQTVNWSAALTGGDPYQHITFELGGLLPPEWLRSTEFKETPVLVYGLPPPGPYLIELEDGRLAVVHPD